MSQNAQEPQYIEFWDRDGRRKQMDSAGITGVWPLSGDDYFQTPDRKYLLATAILRVACDSGEIWLLRGAPLSQENCAIQRGEIAVRLSADRAAAWLIKAGHRLPDELRSSGTPLSDANQGERSEPAKTTRRRGGKPSDTDHREDRRIADAWAFASHKNYAELARELGKSEHHVKLAIDRNRKRQNRRDSTGRTT